jgi:hypothetical protein
MEDTYMTIDVVPYPYCAETSRFTANEVVNRYGTAIFCRYGAKYIAIITHGRVVHNLTNINVIKKRKVSQQKQFMDLQMGRLPKQYINMNENYRVYLVDDTDICNHRYTLYNMKY